MLCWDRKFLVFPIQHSFSWWAKAGDANGNAVGKFKGIKLAEMVIQFYPYLKSQLYWLTEIDILHYSGMVVDLLTKLTPIFWLFNENSYWFLIKFKTDSKGRLKTIRPWFLGSFKQKPMLHKKITWQMIQNLLSVSLNCSKCLLILLQVLTNPLNVFDLCPCWSTLTGFLFRIQVSPLSRRMSTFLVHLTSSYTVLKSLLNSYQCYNQIPFIHR